MINNDQSCNMKAISKPGFENDELICPITLDVFRDPVIAQDGHVYERTAITQWIIEHGTSPITRQPLRVEELKSDDHLRGLAAQQYNSTVSDDVSLHRIPASTVHSIPSIITRTHSIHSNSMITNNERNKCDKKVRCIATTITTICLLMAMIIAITSFSRTSKSGNVLMYSTSKPQLISFKPIQIYSRTWSFYLKRSNSKSYLNKTGGIHYYETIDVTVIFSVSYWLKIISSIHLQTFMYHSNITNPQLSGNISTFNNDETDSSGQFYILYDSPNLKKYTLIVTTQAPNTTGCFNIIIYSYFNQAQISLRSSRTRT